MPSANSIEFSQDIIQNKKRYSRGIVAIDFDLKIVSKN